MKITVKVGLRVDNPGDRQAWDKQFSRAAAREAQCRRTEAESWLEWPL